MTDDFSIYKQTIPLNDSTPAPPIKGRYQIQRELGHGGVGVVYLAHDLQLHNRPVVIKVLLDSWSGEWITKKFRQEIEALSRIEHPGVVGVFDTGEMPNGQLFVVMQFVEGQNLRKVLDNQVGPMKFDYSARILEQVGRALEAAHEKGILHCDLKPENIMLQKLGSGEELVKLIDFGIAKIRDSQITSAAPTQIAGTLEYMAPEQMNGEPCPQSDVFSLGVIAYEMVTGKKPFPSRNLLQLLEMHRNGIKENPGMLRNDLPPSADKAIMKAMSREPTDRQQRPTDFTDELARLLRMGEPSLTKEKETEVYPAKKSRYGILILFCLFLISVAAVSWWLLKIPEQPQPAPVPPPATAQPVPPALPERSFAYGIVVQKYRDGKPYQDPFLLGSQKIIFEPDYKLQFKIRIPKSGFFYALDEGPSSSKETPMLYVLYPSPSSNNSASVADNQDVQLRLEFDKERGTEKIWLIYSLHPVTVLEEAKTFLNDKDMGEIKDSVKARAIAEFLQTQNQAKSEILEDAANKQTTVKGSGDVLVHLVPLEHY